jgi:hypothetical protein
LAFRMTSTKPAPVILERPCNRGARRNLLKCQER